MTTLKDQSNWFSKQCHSTSIGERRQLLPCMKDFAINTKANIKKRSRPSRVMTECKHIHSPLITRRRWLSFRAMKIWIAEPREVYAMLKTQKPEVLWTMGYCSALLCCNTVSEVFRKILPAKWYIDGNRYVKCFSNKCLCVFSFVSKMFPEVFPRLGVDKRRGELPFVFHVYKHYIFVCLEHCSGRRRSLGGIRVLLK